MPTYSENFALLRFGGEAWSGNEEWSCGVKLKHLGGDDVEAMQDECKATIDNCWTVTHSYVGRAASKFSNSAVIRWMKLNVIKKVDGHYAFPHDVVEYGGTAGTGSGGPGVPQLALAVTLRGNYARGTAAFGRWYIPAAYTTVEVDGQIALAVAQGVADSAVTWLEDLQNIDSGLGPDAWSPWLYGSGESGARDSAIVSVECGRVYDTQQRRRNSLQEEHVVGAGWG